MTTRERFQALFANKKPDRLPMIEWASWWNKTTDLWVEEGMPAGMNGIELYDYFGLDRHHQFWISHRDRSLLPQPAYHGAPILTTVEEYRALKAKGAILPKDTMQLLRPRLEEAKRCQDVGDAVWMSLEGYFWFPRTLLGIEPHMYAFYDEPEFYHEICNDLAEWSISMIDQFCEIVTPEFMTFAEDMSYNLGPMLSEECFNEFIKPYYEKVIPHLKKHNIKVIVDSDGDITAMVPWLMSAGIEGILPLERQAGVDVSKLLASFPDFFLIGGFDKMCMFHGPEAIRAEFERILPAMKSGKYIPSVDHQTPPGVKLADYKAYVAMLHEYAERAMQEK